MADIVLRDRNGNQVEYPGVESIKLNTVGGDTKEFIDPDTVPQAVEKTIDPDFSTGDMEVIPEEGQVFSKVGISKPDNLIPGNIAEGVDIAGIVGTLAASGGGGAETGAKVLAKVVTKNDVTEYYATLTIFDETELASAGIDLSAYQKDSEKRITSIFFPISVNTYTDNTSFQILQMRIISNQKLCLQSGYYSLHYYRKGTGADTLKTSTYDFYSSGAFYYPDNGKMVAGNTLMTGHFNGTYLFMLIAQT